jgi:hypothetical protein
MHAAPENGNKITDRKSVGIEALLVLTHYNETGQALSSRIM